MNATTVAVDLAKSVFQLAVADSQWKVIETRRLTRSQFERWFLNRDISLVVMEACGSAHHWARALSGLIRETMKLLIEEIRLLEQRVAQLEKELAELAKQSPACQQLVPVSAANELEHFVMHHAWTPDLMHAYQP